ncbi:MAG: thiolase family protein [Candidatus Jordarchaeum sp.]|uniref:thiolase family protein n=1 Tax=Candidatus Jordarchaeum sp. TaxID=2823881 RepID=UPI00404961EB
MAEELGISISHMWQCFAGGASSSAMLNTAIGLICSGTCDTLLLVCADTWGSQLSMSAAVGALADLHHSDWERPYGFHQVSAVALATRRAMHQGNLTMEDFAHVCVSLRKWAQLNPLARYRDPLTIEQVLNARMISDPYTLYMVPALSDGGSALVVSSAKTAKKTVEKPVYVLGGAGIFEFAGVTQAFRTKGADARSSARSGAAKKALDMAGVKIDDIDVREIYEAYPIGLLLGMFSLGMAKDLRGVADIVNDGRIAPGGDLPTTTDGGLLSRGHSAISGGMMFKTEAVRQLRGEADKRQIKDAKFAYVTCMGGVGGVSFCEVLGTEVPK